MLSPAATAFMICTRPASREVYSTITTASEPGRRGRARHDGRGLPRLQRRNILSARARLDFSDYFERRGQRGKIGSPYRVPVAHGAGEGWEISVCKHRLGQNLSCAFEQLHQFLAVRTQMRGVFFHQVTRVLEAQN